MEQKQEQPSSPEAQVSTAQSVPSGTNIHAHKKHRTFGNKMFDAIVWPAVQGVAVWWASYYIAKEADVSGTTKLFKPIRELTTKARGALEKILEKPISNPTVQKIWKSDTKSWSKYITFYFLTSCGGTLMAPITTWFENHRQSIAKAIDDAHDDILHIPPRNKEEIKPEPKNTFGSILKGRAVYIFGFFPFVVAAGPKGMEWCQKKGADILTNIYKKYRPSADIKKIEQFHAHAEIGVFDSVLTSIAVGATYFISRYFAYKNEQNAEKKNTLAPVADTLPLEDPAEVITSWREKAAPAKLASIPAATHVESVKNTRGDLALS